MAWQQVLNDYEVPEFHAKQFWAFAPKRTRVGPYKNWSDERADDFLEKLVGIIRDSKKKIHPIGTAVVVDAFNRLSHNQSRFLTGGMIQQGAFVTSGAPSKAYFVAFQHSCIKAAQHAAVGGKIHFVFDLNNTFKGYALDAYEILKSSPLKVQDRLGEIAFPTGQDAVQLQAADLLCYQMYQFCRKRVGDKNARPDGVLREVLHGQIDSRDFLFFDDEGLATVLSGAEIPPDLGSSE